MRVGFVTDIHVRESELKYHSFLLAQVAREMKDADLDLVLIGGDLAGITVPHKATPKERNLLTGFVRSLADFAPVVAVRGNHDYPGDYDVWNHLRGRHPVCYIEQPTVVSASRWNVIAYPWLDKSTFRRGSDYRDEILKAYWAATTEQMPPDPKGPVFVLAHAAVNGAMIREGQPTVPTADPVVLVDELCTPGLVDAGFFGHYHLPQEIPDAPCPAFYGGSLFVNQYGEDCEKGWLLFDSETSEATLQTIRQELKITIEVDVDDEVKLKDIRPAGVISVDLGSLGYESKIEKDEDARLLLKIVLHGTEERRNDIKVVSENLRRSLGRYAEADPRMVLRLSSAVREREGASEVASATTLADKASAYFDHLDPAPSKSARSRALDILEEIDLELEAAPGGSP